MTDIDFFHIKTIFLDWLLRPGGGLGAAAAEGDRGRGRQEAGGLGRRGDDGRPGGQEAGGLGGRRSGLLVSNFYSLMKLPGSLSGSLIETFGLIEEKILYEFTLS